MKELQLIVSICSLITSIATLVIVWRGYYGKNK
uniref:Uncharacterized protein n=1 Tax=Firmicutes phage HS11 TaxID=3056393 RepID=A0AA49X496_9VIRU|nr:MAG: hypothetical protein [Firmicutes phage HS11]